MSLKPKVTGSIKPGLTSKATASGDYKLRSTATLNKSVPPQKF
jgi:hypothetical protein